MQLREEIGDVSTDLQWSHAGSFLISLVVIVVAPRLHATSIETRGVGTSETVLNEVSGVFRRSALSWRLPCYTRVNGGWMYEERRRPLF